MNQKEVTWHTLSIDLEWGKLSGKLGIIGNMDSTISLRILGLHGWLDNANSFDTLAPYLPSGTELLVLDLPGHGLSDHLPLGAQYDLLSYVLHIKRAVDKYGWNKFVLLGHSMGSSISFIFTSIFPKYVTAVISVDFVIPIRSKQYSLYGLQESIARFFKGEELRKQKPIVYNEEQAIERLISARTHIGAAAAIDKDAAYVLLPRSAQQVEGGYVWTHDPRARANFQVVFSIAWHAYISCVKCPVLIVTANQGLSTTAMVNTFGAALDVYRRNAKWFDMVPVDGPHHVHLTHPERVAEPVVTFLDRVVKETAAAPPPQAKL